MASTAVPITAQQHIILPLTFDRAIRHVILPNGLEAILLSDPDTDKVTLCASNFAQN